jgi:hypothetical protein
MKLYTVTSIRSCYYNEIHSKADTALFPTKEDACNYIKDHIHEHDIGDGYRYILKEYTECKVLDKTSFINSNSELSNGRGRIVEGRHMVNYATLDTVKNRMTHEEVKERIRLHRIWFDSERKEGVRADFRGVDLSGMNLYGEFLEDADFNEGVFNGTIFRLANLKNTGFVASDLTGADFSDANLAFADLSMSFALFTDFSNAYLLHTNFCSSSFIDTNFTNAELVGTILCGAHTSDTGFKKAARISAHVCDTPENRRLFAGQKYVQWHPRNICERDSFFKGSKRKFSIVH